MQFHEILHWRAAKIEFYSAIVENSRKIVLIANFVAHVINIGFIEGNAKKIKEVKIRI